MDAKRKRELRNKIDGYLQDGAEVEYILDLLAGEINTDEESEYCGNYLDKFVN